MKKEIKLKTFIIVIAILVILEVLLLIFLKPKDVNDYSEKYCKEAICNSDNSMCYAYDLDNNGNTIVVWRGSCQNGN